MEFKALQEQSNLRSNLLVPSKMEILKFSNATDIKSRHFLKPKSTKIGTRKKSVEKENIDADISMMSIKDENIYPAYFLPKSSDLNIKSNIDRFVDNAIHRRRINRDVTQQVFEKFVSKLDILSFDQSTGERYFVTNLDYIQELELKEQPLGTDFLRSSIVTPSMRSAANDKMFYLAAENQVEVSTVQLGMSILDRYTKVKGTKLSPDSYKMATVASWFIACKFDLVYYPAIEDVCSQVDIESIDLIKSLETDVLATIKFYIMIPIPITFLRHLSIAFQIPDLSHNIAKCIVDIMIYSYEFAGHPAHIIASTAYLLALAISQKADELDHLWLPIVKFISGLCLDDIKPLVKSVARFLSTFNCRKETPNLYCQHTIVIDYISNRNQQFNRIANLQ